MLIEWGRAALRRAWIVALGAGLSMAAAAGPTTVSVGAGADTTATSNSMLTFPVTRSGDLSYDAYLAYHTQDKTAANGTDYSAAGGVLRLPAGANVASIPVTIASASRGGADKTFQLVVDGVGGAGPRLQFGSQQVAGATSPYTIATADINGDGKPDVVTGALAGAGVSVLLNTTAPGANAAGFALIQSFTIDSTVGANAIAVAATDLNGDGRPDLVVVDKLPYDLPGNVAILINTTVPGSSTASFAPPLMFPILGSPSSVAVADINGDGKPDVVATNTNCNAGNCGQGTVSVLLNTTVPGGPVDFAAQQIFDTGGVPLSVKAVDLNGDGRPDLALISALSSSSWSASILLNATAPGASTASFGTPQNFAIGTRPTGLAAADMNGDGRPDLVVTEAGDNTTSVLLNTTAQGASTPTFSARQPFNVMIDAASAGPSSIALADLNGDGKIDVLIGDADGYEVSVLMNATPTGSTTAALIGLQTWAAQGAPSAVATADLNGDGKPDLIVSSWIPNAVSTYINTTGAPPLFTTSSLGTASLIASESLGAPELADFSGDGKPDLIAVGLAPAGFSLIYSNTTAGGAAKASFSYTSAVSGSSALAADMNGDGKPDAVGPLNVSMNTTIPGSPITFALGQSAGHVPGFLGAEVVADFNGDFKPDIAAMNFTGLYDQASIYVFLNATTPGATAGSFVPQPAVPFGTAPDSAVAADINGDGKPDVVIGESSFPEGLIVLLNSTPAGAASTSFLAKQLFPIEEPGGGSSSPTVTNAIDLNGDGRPDLVGTYGVGAGIGGIFVLLNTTPAGDTAVSFAAPLMIDMGFHPSFVAAADMDGDGKADLLAVQDYTNPNAYVLINTTAPGASTPSFKSKLAFGVGEGGGIAVEDLNGDGMPDMLVTANNESKLVVRLNAQYQGLIATPTATGTIHFLDTYADPFSFGTMLNVPRGSVQTSGAITVSGINAAVPVTAVHGSYSVNNGPFTTAPGIVNNGDTVVMQQASSPNFGTTTVATLTIGSGANAVAGTFKLSTVPMPPPAPAGLIAVAGIQQVSLHWSTVAGATGYQVYQGTASGGEGSVPVLTNVTATSATVTGLIGGTSYYFEVSAVNPGGEGGRSTEAVATAIAPDSTPDSFSFTPVVNAPLNTLETSNTITVSGINVPVNIFISNGQYSINNGPYTAAAGTVKNGAHVNVQLSSSPNYGTPVASTLTIGEGSGVFSVTTMALDNTPDTFSFIAVTNAPLSTLEKSNSITVSGINAPVNISISNGQYSINNGAFTSAAGTVGNGAQVTVQVTSSASYGTRVLAPLTIGKGGASFSVTTLPPDITPNAFSFTPITNAPLSTLETSSAVTVSGLGPDGASIAVGGGSYSKNGGTFTSAAGTVKNGEVIRVQLMSSASHKTALTAIVKIGTVSGAFSVTTN